MLCTQYFFCMQVKLPVERCQHWLLFLSIPPGSPPQFKFWIGQCLLYLLVVLFEKIVISMLFLLKFWDSVRSFLLKPLRGHPKVELAIVMLVVPLLVNVSCTHLYRGSPVVTLLCKVQWRLQAADRVNCQMAAVVIVTLFQCGLFQSCWDNWGHW